jgi:hypothetical protein
MQRSDAIKYMVDKHRLNPRTAREKIQEATQNPGKTVMVRTHVTVKAVKQPEGSAITWDFVFGDTRY